MFYFLTKKYSEKIINLALKEDLSLITSHHKNIFFSYKGTSNAISNYTIKLSGIINILSKANNANKEEKDKLRDTFSKTLQEYYSIIHKKGVFQYQFVLANGESFYKFHNPTSFGENVLDVRADFKHSIKNKSIVRGFTKGAFSLGFRNIFPVFDTNNAYIGAMEVSFSSEKFQKHLNNISDIHSHFLIPNALINKNDYKYNEYKTSYEHQDYQSLLSKKHNKKHFFESNYIKIKEIIDIKIKGNKSFNMYYSVDGSIRVISFIPIRDMNNKVVAWVSSNRSGFIIGTLVKNVFIVRILIIFILLLLLYFLIRQMSIKTKLEKQQKILSNILNTTKSIMFITDFKNVSFSNRKFDDLIDKAHKKNILSVFQKIDGFLHQGLLKQNEDFVSLINRIPKKSCLVSIAGKDNNAQSYSISISKVEDEYLVTLSNITELKEHLEDTEEKAYIDNLTKVFNRNKFNEVFEEAINQRRLTDSPLSLAMIDIDKFKSFNDTYGHLIGDEVLINMAQTVQRNIRGTDCFARWGGEEFIILFQHTNIQNATIISNKIREKIQKDNHKIAGQITASFGVAQYKAEDTLESILKRCDDALYQAKDNGRNRVEVID